MSFFRSRLAKAVRPVSLALLSAVLLTGCGQGASPGGTGTITGTTPVSGAPTSATTASTLLIWDGAGVNSVDLGCLLATLSGDNVPVRLVTDVDLAAMTGPELAGYLGLVFADGSTAEALATLPASVQQNLQDAVNTYGLHMVAFGGSSGIPGQIGLIPTSSSFWSDLLQIVEVVLDGISLFFPQVAIISQFLNGLPAIVQLNSGNGQVSLFGPQTSNPSCGSAPSTDPSGGSSTVDPLQTLIQMIKAA